MEAHPCIIRPPRLTPKRLSNSCKTFRGVNLQSGREFGAAVDDIKATIEPVGDLGALERAWRALEAQAPRSFFLTWRWARALIAFSPRPLLAATMRTRSGEIVGLGLLCPSVETRHVFLRIRQLRLNEAGGDARAMVPAEYNTLLSAPGHDAANWRALAGALQARDAPPWDEVLVTNATKDAAAGGAVVGAPHRRAENISARVDLKALREQGVADLHGYLAALSKNTRSQIKRSIKLYEAEGPLALRRAQSLDEAKDLFAELAELHEQKWRARSGGGLLSNPHYHQFHLMMMADRFEDGAVELIHVTAGGQTVGILHNFVDDREALYNLGGFPTAPDNRHKPGLVTHALAIADHLAAGRDVYDFMAGGDRYKLNLGVRGPDMVSVAFQRQTLALRAEQIGRKVKHALARRSPLGETE